jgi:hypothetical protein
MAKELTHKQALFVAAYCAGKSATQAAIEAGFAPRNAQTRSYKLLTHNPQVKAAVAAHREKLRLTAGLNAESAMAKFEEARQQAVSKGQMTAAVRALELQCKLAGLLNEKDKGTAGASFSLSIIGIDGQIRATTAPPVPRDITPQAPIDLPLIRLGEAPKAKRSTKNPPDIFG